ncbi:hypothetical protein A5761_12620 [Mycolicibacterium setense]|uniref:DNA-methyltransferase n=1 Tax=Mycolicibacterium setense TaxID=431269 RepID=UPI0007EA6E5B|nr:site-specific DNA-methyltransferase [Mycolicibacterium setense]OBB16189.1 hypothetical protein A5761_12620 [Mycolicibacterium setense]
MTNLCSDGHANKQPLTPYFRDKQVTLYHGKALDVARQLPSGSADCIVSSPPYYNLRDYGSDGQYGLEPTPAEYVSNLRDLFTELRRVLTDDGTLWLNLGDTYSTRADASAGPTSGRSRPHAMPGRINTTTTLGRKQLLGIPWRVAFALQDDGWILRRDIVWDKPNAKPESVTDRPSSRHEYLFLLTKSPRYWFDLDAIRQPQTMRPQRRPNGRPIDTTPRPSGQSRQGWPTAARQTSDVDGHPKGRNPGDVWSINTTSFPHAHFAVMPPALAQRCVMAGCKPDGTVLDPCNGVGTTGLAAQRAGRRYIGIDIKADYLDLSLRTRLRDAALDFHDDAHMADTPVSPSGDHICPPTLHDALGEAAS